MGGGGYYGGGSSSHAGAGGGDLPLFQAIQDAKPFPKTPQAKVQYSTYQVVCITPDFSFMKLKSFLEVHRCHTTSLSPLSPETQMMAR